MAEAPATPPPKALVKDFLMSKDVLGFSVMATAGAGAVGLAAGVVAVAMTMLANNRVVSSVSKCQASRIIPFEILVICPKESVVSTKMSHQTTL